MSLYKNIIPLFGVLAPLYTFWKYLWVSGKDPDTEKTIKISSHISEGAMAFLKGEYQVSIIFVICVATLLAISADPVTSSLLIGVSFVVGAFMTAANIKTINI